MIEDLDINCDCTDFVETIENQQFLVLHKGKTITLIVPVPVKTCCRCGEQFTDYRGEELRDAAVEKYRREND